MSDHEKMRCICCNCMAMAPTTTAACAEEFDRNGVKFRALIPELTILQCSQCGEQYHDDESCDRIFKAVTLAAKEAGL